MIPCKENKCLVYPSCKIKEEVRCHDLFIWINCQLDSWAKVKGYFPNLKTVKAEYLDDRIKFPMHKE